MTMMICWICRCNLQRETGEGGREVGVMVGSFHQACVLFPLCVGVSLNDVYRVDFESSSGETMNLHLLEGTTCRRWRALIKHDCKM